MRRMFLFVILLLTAASCGSKGSPTTPSTTATAATSTTPGGLSVTVSSVSAEAVASGTDYKLTFVLKETSGKSAITLKTIVYNFQNGAGVTTSSGSSDAQTVTIPAGVTVEPKPIVFPTDTSGSPVASQVQVVISFTDAGGRSGSASGVSAVTKIAKFALTGFVKDAANGKGISGLTVKIASGPDNNLTATTNADGYYAFSALQSGTFTVQAGGSGYQSFSKDVTLSANSQVDFSLTVIPPPAPSVEYRITGTARRCSATYENSTGGTNQQEVTIPFTYSWNGARTGDFLYMSCQISTGGDSGNITVSILRNGSVFKSAQAIGFPNIATASGSY